ncbi:alpha/beta fold hydrolase [Taklimakanibacter lacteus]|uniref:alpha/beta fold hydrolase n=1 Tax=Taklimakanibacter lacteus TaxID=2268456 RepID=UPI000E66BFC6
MTTVATLHLKAEVDGEGIPVTFVHGLGGTSNSFQTVLHSLNGHRCIRVDLPGSGRSRLPHETLDIAYMARAVVDAAQSLGAFPGFLVGHSMGTIVCQHIAAMNPVALTGMVLFAPILEPGDAARQRIRDRAQKARSEGMSGVADAVVAAGLSSSTRSNAPVAAAFVRESHMRQDAEAFAQSCEALASATAADLRMIRCPTLLVTGDEDGVAPPASVHAMAEKMKHAKVKVLDRCGHWTMIEKPNECASLLADFLRATRH